MSKYYRISLICIMAVAMAALCILIYRYERQSDSSGIEYSVDRSHSFGEGMELGDPGEVTSDYLMQQEEYRAASEANDITTSDTELVMIEIYPGGISRQSRTELPEELVGLQRTDIMDLLDAYCKAPDALDVEKGLYRIAMTEFSEASITIEKAFHKDARDYYYLAFVDDYVTVFCEDKETVLLNTEIHRDQLPASLREEILNYKLLTGNAELFDFLESYTS